MYVMIILAYRNTVTTVKRKESINFVCKYKNMEFCKFLHINISKDK